MNSSLIGMKIIQKQAFIIEISYFCNRIEVTLSKTYEERKSVMLVL